MEKMNCILTEEEAKAAVGGAARRYTYICDYTVRSGDRLSIIAQDFRTTVVVLQMYNDIPNPDRIYIGQVIKIYR